MGGQGVLARITGSHCGGHATGWCSNSASLPATFGLVTPAVAQLIMWPYLVSASVVPTSHSSTAFFKSSLALNTVVRVRVRVSVAARAARGGRRVR